MKHLGENVILSLLIACTLLSTSCAQRISAEETEKEKAYYEKKYASEPAPTPPVSDVLAFLDGCVGGKYIYGAQGDQITKVYIEKANAQYPDFFTHNRFSYLSAIAAKCAGQGWDFPEDYAWDCSGLWWYCCNELGLYDTYMDKTAHETCHEYCTPITKAKLRPGDLVFLENAAGHITHMGIVGQKGYIYEAVSGFVGVVKKRTVDKRVYNNVVNGGVLAYPEWNAFGRPKIFK